MTPHVSDGGVVPSTTDSFINAGDEIDLTCEITTSPLTPSIQWYFNSDPVASATTTLLNIASAKGTDSGLYKCTVTWPNSVGTLTTPEYTIYVRDIVTTPTDAQWFTGGAEKLGVTLTCTVYGDRTQAGVTWSSSADGTISGADTSDGYSSFKHISVFKADRPAKDDEITCSFIYAADSQQIDKAFNVKHITGKILLCCLFINCSCVIIIIYSFEQYIRYLVSQHGNR